MADSPVDGRTASGRELGGHDRGQQIHGRLSPLVVWYKQGKGSFPYNVELSADAERRELTEALQTAKRMVGIGYGRVAVWLGEELLALAERDGSTAFVRISPPLRQKLRLPWTREAEDYVR